MALIESGRDILAELLDTSIENHRLQCPQFFDAHNGFRRDASPGSTENPA